MICKFSSWDDWDDLMGKDKIVVGNCCQLRDCALARDECDLCHQSEGFV